MVDGTGFGGHLRSCFVVSLGKELRYLAEMALARVDSTGENKEREKNSILSAIVGSSIVFNEWLVELSMIHSLDRCLGLCIIILPLLKMFSFFL